MTNDTAFGIGIAIGLVLLFAALSVFGGQFATPINAGTYEGETVDYSHQRGLIFQTNDLTTKTNDRSSQREDWCVPDNDQQLVEKVRGIPEGAEVTITYHRPLFIWPDTCDGGLKVIDTLTVTNSSS